MTATDPPYDAVVVGAGFAGLYALHVLRDTYGLSVRGVERGADVGGVWFWNRYLGCRCDIESYNYSYSFDEQLQQEWSWSERFAGQPEILRYLEHVATRFDLRRDIAFGTEIVSAAFDDATATWVLRTDAGETLRARFLVAAVGAQSAVHEPDLPGLAAFGGTVHATARWPREGVDLAGRAVAVIGTGCSGIQVIPHLAEQAAHLTAFQRTPNYATPIGNGAMDPEFERYVKGDYAGLRRRSRESPFGVPYGLVAPSALAVSDAERRRVYARRWAEGGLRLAFDSFADLLFDRSVNETASEFVRARIRERVADPAVAEMLVPTDHPYTTKRPPLETGYYETFNRPDVTLVDLRAEPVEAVTPRGIRTAAGEYPVDDIVLATGFDTLTGPLLRLDVTGRGGRALRDHWADGARTYLGLMAHGFPNLFMITGPQSPSVFYNAPLAAEDHVEWVAAAIDAVRRRGARCIEPERAAEDDWVEQTNRIADATLLPEASSWLMGANVPGKPRVCLAYLGGAPAYRQICADVVSDGYSGFRIGG